MAPAEIKEDLQRLQEIKIMNGCSGVLYTMPCIKIWTNPAKLPLRLKSNPTYFWIKYQHHTFQGKCRNECNNLNMLCKKNLPILVLNTHSFLYKYHSNYASVFVSNFFFRSAESLAAQCSGEPLAPSLPPHHHSSSVTKIWHVSQMWSRLVVIMLIVGLKKDRHQIYAGILTWPPAS